MYEQTFSYEGSWTDPENLIHLLAEAGSSQLPELKI